MAEAKEEIVLSFYQDEKTIDTNNATQITKAVKLEVSMNSKTTGGNTNTGEYSLSKVKWNKTINEPSMLEAEINFATSIFDDNEDEDEDEDGDEDGDEPEYNFSSVAEVITALRQSYADLTLKETDENENTTSTDIALHFVVFSIIRSDQEGNVSLAITAYSPDKLLDIDEYCKAYTAKKLVREIVLNQGNKFDADKDNTDPATGKKIGQCARALSGEATVISFDASGEMTAELNVEPNLNVLKYKDSNKNEDEFVQPYLVQYNETFYSFLVRTMNRYGEFVYYEDDAFHLGLKETTPAKELSTGSNGNVNSVEWNNCCAEADTTSLEQYNYTKSFPTQSSNVYHDEVVDDANLVRIKTAKEKKSDFNSWQSGYAKRYFIDKVPKFPFLLPSISKIVFYVVDLVYNYFVDSTYATYLSTKNSYEGNFIDTARSESANSGEVYPYTTNPDNTNSLSSLFSNKLIDSQLCRTIYQQEMQAEKGMIIFNISKQPVMCNLGDVVKYDGGTFVVTGIEYDYTTDEGKIYALPQSTTYNMFLPSPIKGERIRKASPQPAVVTDNADHEGLGRVRVRYAWQEEAASGEYSSPLIRMVQPFASTNESGTMFLPATDDEVLVNFMDGNVEMPYVEGMLYSSTNKTRNFPSTNTMGIKSRNGHEIRFNDPTGNLSFITSISPMLSTVNTFMTMGGAGDKMEINSKNGSAGGITLTDSNSLYKINLSADQRKISIKSTLGDVEIDALTGIKINAPGGDISIKGKNILLEASNNVTIKSGTKIEPWGWKMAATTGWGAAAMNFLKSKITIIDLSLVRTIMEMFVPPSEGTLLLKSARHLALEAGKGDTHIGMTKNNDKISHIAALVNYIDAWSAFVRDYEQFIRDELKNFRNGELAYGEYRQKAQELINADNTFNDASLFIDGDNTFLYFCNNYTNTTFPDMPAQTNQNAYRQASSSYDKLMTCAQSMQKPENTIYASQYAFISAPRQVRCIPAGTKLDAAIRNFALIKKDEFVDSNVEINTQMGNIRKAARQAIEHELTQQQQGGNGNLLANFDFNIIVNSGAKEVKQHWNDVIDTYKRFVQENLKDPGKSNAGTVALDLFLNLNNENKPWSYPKELNAWREYSKQDFIRFSDNEERVLTFGENHAIEECDISDIVRSISKMKGLLKD